MLKKTIYLLVEYALGSISNKLFASKYCLSLPDKELLQKAVEKIINKEKKSLKGKLMLTNIFAITKDDNYLDNLNKQTKIRELERQIDQLVYKLYGLTEDEIKIVEGQK